MNQRNQQEIKNEKRNQDDFRCDESADNDQIERNNNKKDIKYQKKMDTKNGLDGNDQDQQKQLYQKEYQSMNFKYANEGFTIQSNNYIKRMASQTLSNDKEVDAKRNSYACKYPLYKMIRSVVKKFQFNELEIIFFAYLVDYNKWNADDENIKAKAFYWQDYLNITEIENPLEYKSVLLFLLMNAYAVKSYLNDAADFNIFKWHMSDLIPDFKSTFTNYSKKLVLKINPKKLNEVFKKLSHRDTSDANNEKEDYNSLVDAIIQISPPYNNDKNQNNHNINNKNQQQDINNSHSNIQSSYPEAKMNSSENKKQKQENSNLNANQFNTMNPINDNYFQNDNNDILGRQKSIDIFGTNYNLDQNTSLMRQPSEQSAFKDMGDFNLNQFQNSKINNNQNDFSRMINTGAMDSFNIFNQNNIQSMMNNLVSNNNFQVNKSNNNQGKTKKTQIIQNNQKKDDDFNIGQNEKDGFSLLQSDIFKNTTKDEHIN